MEPVKTVTEKPPKLPPKTTPKTTTATTTNMVISGPEARRVSIATSNGVGTCAGSSVSLDTAELRRKRYSLGSFTYGLWELASADAASSGSSPPSSSTTDRPPPPPHHHLHQQLALPPPPLPALPPVGPSRRRSKSQSLTRTPSLPAALPSDSKDNATPSSASPQRPYGSLQRSQSMADVFSAMVAAKLKPAAAAPNFAKSTHCQECNQRFSLIFRRHHCRTCQRSVCAYCSTYQRVPYDLAEETETELQEDQEGAITGGTARITRQNSLHKTVLQRVCRKCAAEMESKKTGLYRSWTEEFFSLRQFFKQGRQSTPGVLGETQLLPPKIPRMPKVCEAIAASFLEECRKHVSHRSRFLTASASFNSGLQYALKPPDQKLCHTCGRVLRFPVERKTCALCEETFCRNCSSRDLALSLPDDLDPGDIGHEIAQVNVRILTQQEAEEMDRNSNPPPGVAPGHTVVQRYRCCLDCREHVHHVMKVIAFNDTLTQVQAELVDLQEQIAAVLDDQDNPSPGIGMTRWPSVRSVHTYTSVEDEIVGEAVSYRVAEKLLERYFRVFLQLERLSPETATQSMLLKHVKQAMSTFYMTRRSFAAKRFNGRESIVTLPSAPHYL